MWAANNRIVLAVVAAGWLLFGMLAYHYLNDGLDWADAFYFSVQAGFSIGFG